MKKELYCYATSLKDNGLQKIPSFCFWVLLSIFLIPLILENIVLGLILTCAFILLSIIIKKETTMYDRELLRIAISFLFLGIEFSVLTEIQYNITFPLILAITVSLIAYEIIFLINVKRKAYSTSNLKKTNWMNIIPLILGGTGIWAGKLIAKSANIDIKLFVVILICSSIIMYSFTFIQKFILYKIIK